MLDTAFNEFKEIYKHIYENEGFTSGALIAYSVVYSMIKNGTMLNNNKHFFEKNRKLYI